MNRTFINFLSVIIIAILAASVFMPVVEVASGFNDGFREADRIEATDTNNTPMLISMNANHRTLLNPEDTIHLNNKNVSYPIIYKQAILMVPDKATPTWLDISCIVGYLVNAILFIALMIDFVKFIIRINKGEVFVDRNVRYLRRISVYLISISICTIITGMTDSFAVNGLNIGLTGYEISSSWSIPWATLMLGFLSLLMAQIWRRGIQLNEEQKYTI